MCVVWVCVNKNWRIVRYWESYILLVKGIGVYVVFWYFNLILFEFYIRVKVKLNWKDNWILGKSFFIRVYVLSDYFTDRKK